MPRYDKTGPDSLGPRTGRQMGRCNIDSPEGNFERNRFVGPLYRHRLFNRYQPRRRHLRARWPR